MITVLTTMHVSRTIRQEVLVEIRDRYLVIRDREVLKAVALLHNGYRHLGREGRHLDANDGVRLGAVPRA